MRLRLQALAVLTIGSVVLVACGKDEARSPVGLWIIEPEQYAKQMLEFTKDMPGAPKEADYFKRAANVEIEFKADGTWTSKGMMERQKIDESGVWRLEGDQLTLVWKTKGGLKAPEWKQTVTYDGSSFDVVPEQNAPFPLHLVRKP
jgi:hypothetical protein